MVSPYAGQFSFGRMSKIFIKPSHKGLFKKKANNAGMSTMEYANKVLAAGNKASAATRKQAQFAKNASHWHKG